jgi:hypothetical protein
MISRPQSLQTWLQLGLCLCISMGGLSAVFAAESQEGAPSSCLDGAADPTMETLLGRYDLQETRLKRLKATYDRFSQRFIEDYDLASFQELFKKFDVQMENVLNRIFEPSPDSRIGKDLFKIEMEMRRADENLRIWLRRIQPLSYDEVMDEPMALMPGRIYNVRSERGETFRVRFGRTLVEQFYWENRDSGRKDAALQSLKGVHRGIRPSTSGAAGGVDFFKVVDGIQTLKIQIVGHGVGAYRVYGCLKNGVMEFLLWEHEGLHDARYISRVTHHTADLCKEL